MPLLRGGRSLGLRRSFSILPCGTEGAPPPTQLRLPLPGLVHALYKSSALPIPHLYPPIPHLYPPPQFFPPTLRCVFDTVAAAALLGAFALAHHTHCCYLQVYSFAFFFLLVPKNVEKRVVEELRRTGKRSIYIIYTPNIYNIYAHLSCLRKQPVIASCAPL